MSTRTEDGVPVLLIHSGGFTSRQWRRLGALLSPKHAVRAPDLLGYGASPWPRGKPFHFRDDLALLAAITGEASTPWHLVGHSYGGFLALKLALLHPERVRSIAVYEPVAFGVLDSPSDEEARKALEAPGAKYVLPEEGADERWLSGFVDWWNGPGAWNALPEETKAAFRAVGWKLSEEVASLSADRTDTKTYGTITAPTLLLGGERSPMTERRVLEKLSQALPSASLRILSLIHI